MQQQQQRQERHHRKQQNQQPKAADPADPAVSALLNEGASGAGTNFLYSRRRESNGGADEVPMQHEHSSGHRSNGSRNNNHNNHNNNDGGGGGARQMPRAPQSYMAWVMPPRGREARHGGGSAGSGRDGSSGDGAAAMRAVIGAVGPGSTEASGSAGPSWSNAHPALRGGRLVSGTSVASESASRGMEVTIGSRTRGPHASSSNGGGGGAAAVASIVSSGGARRAFAAAAAAAAGEPALRSTQLDPLAAAQAASRDAAAAAAAAETAAKANAFVAANASAAGSKAPSRSPSLPLPLPLPLLHPGAPLDPAAPTTDGSRGSTAPLAPSEPRSAANADSDGLTFSCATNGPLLADRLGMTAASSAWPPTYAPTSRTYVAAARSAHGGASSSAASSLSVFGVGLPPDPGDSLSRLAPLPLPQALAKAGSAPQLKKVELLSPAVVVWPAAGGGGGGDVGTRAQGGGAGSEHDPSAGALSDGAANRAAAGGACLTPGGAAAAAASRLQLLMRCPDVLLMRGAAASAAGRGRQFARGRGGGGGGGADSDVTRSSSRTDSDGSPAVVPVHEQITQLVAWCRLDSVPVHQVDEAGITHATLFVPEPPPQHVASAASDAGFLPTPGLTPASGVGASASLRAGSSARPLGRRSANVLGALARRSSPSEPGGRMGSTGAMVARFGATPVAATPPGMTLAASVSGRPSSGSAWTGGGSSVSDKYGAAPQPPLQDVLAPHGGGGHPAAAGPGRDAGGGGMGMGMGVGAGVAAGLPATPTHLVYVAWRRGQTLGPAAPVLLLPPGMEAVAAELRALQPSSSTSLQAASFEDFLGDFGMWLEAASAVAPAANPEGAVRALSSQGGSPSPRSAAAAAGGSSARQRIAADALVPPIASVTVADAAAAVWAHTQLQAPPTPPSQQQQQQRQAGSPPEASTHVQRSPLRAPREGSGGGPITSAVVRRSEESVMPSPFVAHEVETALGQQPRVAVPSTMHTASPSAGATPSSVSADSDERWVRLAEEVMGVGCDLLSYAVACGAVETARFLLSVLLAHGPWPSNLTVAAAVQALGEARGAAAGAAQPPAGRRTYGSAMDVTRTGSSALSAAAAGSDGSGGAAAAVAAAPAAPGASAALLLPTPPLRRQLVLRAVLHTCLSCSDRGLSLLHSAVMSESLPMLCLVAQTWPRELGAPLALLNVPDISGRLPVDYLPPPDLKPAFTPHAEAILRELGMPSPYPSATAAPAFAPPPGVDHFLPPDAVLGGDVAAVAVMEGVEVGSVQGEGTTSASAAALSESTAATLHCGTAAAATDPAAAADRDGGEEVTAEWELSLNASPGDPSAAAMATVQLTPAPLRSGGGRHVSDASLDLGAHHAGGGLSWGSTPSGAQARVDAERTGTDTATGSGTGTSVTLQTGGASSHSAGLRSSGPSGTEDAASPFTAEALPLDGSSPRAAAVSARGSVGARAGWGSGAWTGLSAVPSAASAAAGAPSVVLSGWQLLPADAWALRLQRTARRPLHALMVVMLGLVQAIMLALLNRSRVELLPPDAPALDMPGALLWLPSVAVALCGALSAAAGLLLPMRALAAAPWLPAAITCAGRTAASCMPVLFVARLPSAWGAAAGAAGAGAAGAGAGGSGEGGGGGMDAGVQALLRGDGQHVGEPGLRTLALTLAPLLLEQAPAAVRGALLASEYGTLLVLLALYHGLPAALAWLSYAAANSVSAIALGALLDLQGRLQEVAVGGGGAADAGS